MNEKLIVVTMEEVLRKMIVLRLKESLKKLIVLPRKKTYIKKPLPANGKNFQHKITVVIIKEKKKEKLLQILTNYCI